MERWKQDAQGKHSNLSSVTLTSASKDENGVKYQSCRTFIVDRETYLGNISNNLKAFVNCSSVQVSDYVNSSFGHLQSPQIEYVL